MPGQYLWPATASCGAFWPLARVQTELIPIILTKLKESSIPFLGTLFPLLCMGFRDSRPQPGPNSVNCGGPELGAFPAYQGGRSNWLTDMRRLRTVKLLPTLGVVIVGTTSCAGAPWVITPGHGEACLPAIATSEYGHAAVTQAS